MQILPHYNDAQYSDKPCFVFQLSSEGPGLGHYCGTAWCWNDSSCISGVNVCPFDSILFQKLNGVSLTSVSVAILPAARVHGRCG